ncbi:MAG: hypothetical protein LBE31_04410, partial [Deltaproteobacteria bacterium]|nr:hypothetical protein [Deltaproteobacteria bacterium]
MDKETSTYVLMGIEVSGVQSFIFSTGKLKEMVGASQIIVEVASDLYDEVTSLLELTPALRPMDGSNWIVTSRNNAGVLRALLPNRETGKKFLKEFSSLALDKWPGLPLNGALVDCGFNQESLLSAGQELSKLIEGRRARYPVPKGLNLLPPLQMAPLDGLAAFERDYAGEKTTLVSWPSSVKRNVKTIDRANKRLKDEFNEVFTDLSLKIGSETISWPVELEAKWVDDFDEMLEGREKPRLALIHLDVNDLGHMMAGSGKDNLTTDPAKVIEEQNKKSALIDQLNKSSFSAALRTAIELDLSQHNFDVKNITEYLIPLRPLVIGGDDVTVLVRADLAFP